MTDAVQTNTDPAQSETAATDEAAAGAATDETVAAGTTDTDTTEEYTDVTYPEGAEVDEQLLGDFQGLAKKHNLSQEAAQEFIDMQAAVAAKGMQISEEQAAARATEWVETVKADAELGGDDADSKIATARKAVQTFATPEFLQMLDSTGFGSHPEFVRAFYRVGKVIGDDTISADWTNTSKSQDRLSILYED